VVVYSALDAEFSEPILKEFGSQSGVAVRPKFDVESTKTVGLTNELLQERGRPRCDVFWNNEILNTLRLEREGLLEPYRPAAAEAFPAMCRSPRGTWHGFAARARVLIVNKDLTAEGGRPSSVLDLTDRRWWGKAGIAKPLFGTTATHAACLFSAWGDDLAKEFFGKLRKNEVQVLSGNKQVALSVGRGQLAFGLTDTDDALEELAQGRPVAIVYPDQGPEGIGTLVIPNTVAIIKGGPNPEAARQLVDYLLSPGVETKLAAGPSGQVPLRKGLAVPDRLGLPKDFRQMEVDFVAAAARWDAAAKFLREEFARD
jgi:iron(III) transport system substrate-binding protein